MCKITEKLKQEVWKKGEIIANYDSTKYRKDACGAWMIFDRYGDRKSIFGWNIDHIFPQSVLRNHNVPEEEIDDIANLRPLNWLNNESKGTDYPVYHAQVTSADNKNIRVDFQYDISEETQNIISQMFAKYL